MNRHVSLVLVSAVGALVALGLVTLFSAEQVSRTANFGKHVVWVLLGSTGCYALTMIDYRRWQGFAWWGFGIAAFLLALCYSPIGKEIHGARRWINIGYPFQPSELAKLAGILFLAAWYTKWHEKAGTTLYGFILPGLCMTVLVALIAGEVDIGASTLLGVVTAIVMLMAGVRFRWLILGVLGAFAAVGLAIKSLPERLGRFLAFLEPEKHLNGDFWQQNKGLTAFGVGGWDGVGIGNIMHYVKKLPFLESDFIFPVLTAVGHVYKRGVMRRFAFSSGAT